MDPQTNFMITQLVLTGHRKNYTLPFFPGVNIIYGDGDTGKSSILRLINYLLGGKQIKLDTEISSSVKYATLEILVDNTKYCIQRDLYNNKREVEIYSCSFNEIKNNFPEKFAASISQSTDAQKSLSEFLLELLNFPAVKLKQAPSKDNSSTARLSILDLFKFMYLGQDDVGSGHMLNIGNPVLETKNREVLKYIFNVLDSNITDLDQEISEKVKEQNTLQQQLTVILKFLDDTQFYRTESIQNHMSSIEDKLLALNEKLADINKRITLDSDFYEEMKAALEQINSKIKNTEFSRLQSLDNLDRFGRLLNDYNNDINKIHSASRAQKRIGIGIENEIEMLCPLCDSSTKLSGLSEKFSISSSKELKNELTSITRRSKDLDLTITNNRNKVSLYSEELNELYEARNKAKQVIDEKLENSISPYLSERDAIVGELASLKEKKSKYHQASKIRNRQNQISDHISRLATSVDVLKIKRTKLINESPSIDSVLQSVGNDLRSYLSKVQIKNRSEVSINPKSYLPVIRGVDYRNISSGSVRTVTSIGFFASLLKAKLKIDTNLPSLLMIDTVGKYLGKTGTEYEPDLENSEILDGVSDPEKYQNIYNYFFDLAEEFKNADKLCQIILVDNDIPSKNAFMDKEFGVTHYSTNGLNDLPIGLIDDWKVQN